MQRTLILQTPQAAKLTTIVNRRVRKYPNMVVADCLCENLSDRNDYNKPDLWRVTITFVDAPQPVQGVNWLEVYPFTDWTSSEI